MRDFRDLEVWRKAHEVTLAVYQMTRIFPREEVYGLTAQMRRSAASVCANIAEGCGRRGGRELARFLQIAAGSASELEYHLLLAADLKLVDGAAHGTSRRGRRPPVSGFWQPSLCSSIRTGIVVLLVCQRCGGRPVADKRRTSNSGLAVSRELARGTASSVARWLPSGGRRQTARETATVADGRRRHERANAGSVHRDTRFERSG